jgi:hypothetical protein
MDHKDTVIVNQIDITFEMSMCPRNKSTCCKIDTALDVSHNRGYTEIFYMVDPVYLGDVTTAGDTRMKKLLVKRFEEKCFPVVVEFRGRNFQVRR